MTEPIVTAWSDEDLDGFVRNEMRRLAAACPAPAVRDVVDAPPRRRLRLPAWTPAPERPRRLAPLAAAVALAVAAGGAGSWLAVHRLHGRSLQLPASTATPLPTPKVPPTLNVVVPPVPSPSPSFVPPAQLPSTVDATVPVVYYVARDGQQPGAVRVDAVDWSGRPRGHLDITGESMPRHQSETLPFLQSPDGSHLLIAGEIYAANGTHLGSLGSDARSKVWSDDDAHVCEIGNQVSGQTGEEYSLLVHGLDGGVQSTTHMPHPIGDDAGYSVIACSPTRDRAVVDLGVDVGITQLYVLRLSTGAVMLQHDYCTDQACGGELLDAVATPDGRMVVEAAASGVVSIRALPSGGVVSRLPQRGNVLAVSADGSRVAVEEQPGSSHPYIDQPWNRVDVIDIARRAIVATWNSGGAQVAAQPAGSGLVLALLPVITSYPTAGPDGYLPLGPGRNLVLLTTRGSTTVARNVETLCATTF